MNSEKLTPKIKHQQNKHQQKSIRCLSEFFQDHRFGSDSIIDEIETKESLFDDYFEDLTRPDEFNDWFRELAESGDRFAKSKRAV